MTKHQTSPKIGDSTIDDWEVEWTHLNGGLRQRHHEFDGLLGLFRLTLNGQDVFIGTGIDIKDGLPKRLYDFHRQSDSGRDHHAGRLIYEHRDQLEVQVLITGTDREAQRFSRLLKTVMVERHKPAWNAPVPLRTEGDQTASQAVTASRARRSIGCVAAGLGHRLAGLVGLSSPPVCQQVSASRAGRRAFFLVDHLRQ